MRKHFALMIAVSVLLVASLAAAAIFTLPTGIKQYTDRDGNTYTADSNGQVSVPDRYHSDVVNAGLVRQAAFAFVNSTTAVGTCRKNDVRWDGKNIQVCYSSNVSPGWKKSPVR